MVFIPRNDLTCQAVISRTILLCKLPRQSVMLCLGHGLGLKANIFVLGLEANVLGLGLAARSLFIATHFAVAGLVPCGIVNVTGTYN